jgi:D-aminoacyl-tRNA deacylase
MKLVIQYVSKASVTVADQTIAAINHGYLVLVGISQTDTPDGLEKMATKLLRLRLIPDANGKINQDIGSTQGEILLVPQFTLIAYTQKGNRPNFSEAASPAQATLLFDQFVDILKSGYPKIKTGSFGAHMKVSLTNDGPITLVIDSESG